MKASKGEKIFYAANNAFLLVIALLCLMPFLNILAQSFSSTSAVSSGNVFIWPVGFNLSSYEIFFNNARAFTAVRNSVIITVVSVISQIFFITLCAYPLSRKYFIGKKQFTLFIVFTMMFSGGIIPFFLLLRFLGFINSYAAIWIPFLVNTFYMLIMRTFFEGLPEELMEAAEIDGCGEFRKLFHIVIPLSQAVFGSVILFLTVNSWNAFTGVLMFIQDSAKHNLPVMINQMTNNLRFMQDIPESERQLVLQNITPESVRAAGVVILILPMIILYPSLQKYFVKGVTLGAVKG